MLFIILAWLQINYHHCVENYGYHVDCRGRVLSSIFILLLFKFLVHVPFIHVQFIILFVLVKTRTVSWYGYPKIVKCKPRKSSCFVTRIIFRWQFCPVFLTCFWLISGLKQVSFLGNQKKILDHEIPALPRWSSLACYERVSYW